MFSDLTDEQKDIRIAARAFAKGEFPGVAGECDVKESFPVALWRKACGLGFVGMHLAEGLGGAGAGTLECSMVMEEFSRVDAGCAGITLTTLGSEIIERFGSDEQKRSFLPPLPEGKAIMALAWLGPSRDGRTGTRAKREGEGFKIEGRSISVIHGTLATQIMVIGQIESGEISAFLLDGKQEGLKKRAISGKLGMRATDLAEIDFENPLVREEQVIKGAEIFSEMLQRIQLYKASQSVGIAQGALDLAVSYIKQRSQFGRPIGCFQGIRHEIAELGTRIEAARSLCYRACTGFDARQREGTLSRMANFFAGETACWVAGKALQMHGGYGFTKDFEIERFYRDAHTVEMWQWKKESDRAALGDQMMGGF